MNIYVYLTGFCITLIAGIIFAAKIGDDFFEDFLPITLGAIVAAFMWPVILVIVIAVLILRGIWLLIRAEDLHRNVWKWVKKVWVKI